MGGGVRERQTFDDFLFAFEPLALHDLFDSGSLVGIGVGHVLEDGFEVVDAGGIGV